MTAGFADDIFKNMKYELAIFFPKGPFDNKSIVFCCSTEDKTWNDDDPIDCRRYAQPDLIRLTHWPLENLNEILAN